MATEIEHLQAARDHLVRARDHLYAAQTKQPEVTVAIELAHQAGLQLLRPIREAAKNYTPTETEASDGVGERTND